MRSLGHLIDALGPLPAVMPVRLLADDDPGSGVTGLGLCSWRGFYAEVTVCSTSTQLVTDTSTASGPGYSVDYGSSWNRFDPAETVGELLAAAMSTADGGVLEGYKGGLYRMSRSTILWADPWGAYASRTVSRLIVIDGVATLVTEGPASDG